MTGNYRVDRERHGRDMDLEKSMLEKQRMKMLCSDEICTVFQMENETGEGTATVYQPYSGIYIMYNDYHMAGCPARQIEYKQTIIIEHCREGRIEWETSNGTYLYLAAGDTMLDSLSSKNQMCNFPLCHYHGVNITVVIPEIDEETRELFASFGIDLLLLEKRFDVEKNPFVMHGGTSLDHIFHELYHVPEKVRLEYLRVKILEILVLLKAVDKAEIEEVKPYFYKSQVEKVKAIMELMTSNPEIHYTMEELAEEYDIPVSALKKCFKGVYGTAIFTYMRNFRMDMAATLLIQTDDSITDIAGKVGYANCSKFAGAFKSVKGKAPLEYRKTKR